MEQRYQAVLAVIADGRGVGEVAAQFGVSRQSVHAWLRRYEDHGLEGLANRSHKPKSIPHHMPSHVEAAVLELRREHRAWGPRRLVRDSFKLRVHPLPSVDGFLQQLNEPRTRVVYPRLMAHGVMFHHFHSESAHVPKPGSIDCNTLLRMLDHLSEHYRLLKADEFLENALQGALEPKDVVLTFDDALLSQIDVALPVLEDASVSAVLNVYSSVFSAEPDLLEIYADFRATAFEDFPSFWSEFLAVSNELFPDLTRRLADEYPEGYLSDFPFYSESERRFRFLRDRLLRPVSYRSVMDEMLDRSTYDLDPRIIALWMGKEHLVGIVKAGHVVGLHSHSHPTRMSELSREQQKLEYRQNYDWITEELGVAPYVVAHPCGDYSEDTLGVLRELGIRVGFRSSMTVGRFGSLLELPRKDHAVLLKELGYQ